MSTDPIAYRVADHDLADPQRGNIVAWAFVGTMLLLLSLPTLDAPIWLRVGRVVVWLLQLAGVEFGPMLS